MSKATKETARTEAQAIYETTFTSEQLVEMMQPTEERPLWETDEDIINPYLQLPPNPCWCKIGERQALPKEGIVTFSAKQKKGKSASTYACALSLLSGNTFDTLQPTDRPKLVLAFDMEMSKATLTNRVLQQIKAIGKYGDRFAVCSLKAKNITERISFIASKIERYNPDIVIIDQAAKLVQDINNTAETSAITDFLDKLSIGRSVWVVMHENKTDADNNMRGHLGSYLSFAAVEAYSVDKKDGVFTITPKEARDTETEDAACIRFAIDADGQIIDASAIYQASIVSEIDALRSKFKTLFGNDTTLQRSELIRRIKKQENIADRQANTIITKARDVGVILRTSGLHKAPYKFVQ